VAVFHKLASPKYFYDISGKLIPWFGALFLIALLAVCIWLGCGAARLSAGSKLCIMFVMFRCLDVTLHLYPDAALSAINLIWNIKLRCDDP